MKSYDDLLVALDDFRDRSCFLFDMDGLIFDTEQLFMEQLAVAMADRGYHLTREVYLHTLGMGGERQQGAGRVPDRPRRAGSDGAGRGDDRPGRHPEQEPSGRQRDFGRVSGVSNI